MLTIEEIARFMSEDERSDKKRFARTGVRYYEGDHDIREYRMYYRDAEGNLVEDRTRSNIKVSHPFFTELVDQEVQYMLSGRDGFARSDDPELQALLDDYINDDEGFMSELYDVITGCVVKGFEYMYAYKGADDRVRFQCADSMGVVEVRARDTAANADHVIYWYVDRIGEARQLIRRIQVWDDERAWFYVQKGEGRIEPDPDAPLNPRPHTIYRREEGGDTYYEGFGFIPFFRLDNCRKQFNGLKAIKGLIDDYDLMSCGLSNNLQDVTEGLYVVKGFQGDDLDELIQNVRTKKHIGVDENGDVDIKTVDIPYDARKAKLELDEKNIYRFGMGFNSAQIGDGNVTNVVIKSRYALLDLKCNKLEIRLKRFLRRILDVILAEINDANGTDYSQRDVRFEFEREVMTNASDNAQIRKTDAETAQVQVNTLMTVAQNLDDETLMQNICAVLDIDYEEVKGKLPKSPEQSVNDAVDDLMGAAEDEEIG